MVKTGLVYLLGAVTLVAGMWLTSLIGLWGFDPEGRPSDGCVFWAWYWGPDDCPIRAFPAVAVDPSADQRATPEPEQSVDATSPTAEPTPSVTSAPESESADSDRRRFHEFGMRWDTAPDSDLADELMTALLTNDPSEYQPAARTLLDWAKTELEWLNDHPPAACYAGIHGRWRDAVSHVIDAASLFAQSGPDDSLAMSGASGSMVSYLEITVDMFADVASEPCTG